MTKDSGINPDFKAASTKSVEVKELFTELRKGNKTALSKAITLVESTDKSKRESGKELVKMAFPFSGKSKRIGVTGVPGAGKSTFIESIGKRFLDNGGKLAVLAIDPTSTLNKGSILGDKTRMQELSVHPNVFIRPTPSGTELGGVARNTFEVMILCEAAGFDHIFVETVGVGQSETEVKQLTDLFILLMIAGAGDELQGIKRGIMEMADLIVVNKTDGSNVIPAQKAAKEIANAVQILSERKAGWQTKVNTYSSINQSGENDLLINVNQYFSEFYQNETLNELRAKQQLYWFNKYLNHNVLSIYIESNNLSDVINNIEIQLNKGEISAFEAVDMVLKKQ